VVDDHVVPIHNVETDGEHPFLVMKFIAGGSLQQRIDREGPLEVCEVLRIGMQTAKGLAAAHAQGLIHRDVKPSNILLDEGVDRALLTDFGLARATNDASLTRSGFHPGTPHYMSPEQVRGEAIDARSDLFGLGCVLYAMCTGHPPFRSETSYAVLRRITDDAPRPIRESNSSTPVWLERIVMRLLAKSPEDRYVSAIEAHRLLERCLAHVQQPTTVELPSELQSKSASHKWRAALAMVPACIAIGCGLWWFNQRPAEIDDRAADPQTEIGSLSTELELQWESDGKEFESLREDFETLETTAKKLWDVEPRRK
jgi:serine/threonine protein kinase